LVNSKHQKDSWWDPRREGLNFEPKNPPFHRHWERRLKKLVDLMFSKFQVPTDHWEYNIPPGRGWPEVSHVTNSLGFGFFYGFCVFYHGLNELLLSNLSRLAKLLRLFDVRLGLSFGYLT